MSIYDSKLWLDDIEEIIKSLPEIELLADKSLLITGCTGLICSAVVDVLISWNTTHEKKIKIIAAGRRTSKILDRFAPYSTENWFTVIPFDASKSNLDLNIACDYIIHGASNASPNKITKEPVETMLSNFLGMKSLLDYAKDNNTKRILYISSSEVYGKKTDNLPYKENEYGYIDLINSRNSYSVGKRATETLCASYAAEYGIESVIVRPGHIYGPTAVESDNRVSSMWAYNVARGEDIVMKSDGAQVRSYCYCLDCASAILTVLLKGKNVHAYNISNQASVVSIREMAEILTNNSGVNLRIELPTEDEKKGFNPMNNSSLDSQELLSLGWNGLFDVGRGLAHTVEILKDLLKLSKTGQQGR